MTLTAGLVAGSLQAQEYGTKVTATAATPVSYSEISVTTSAATVSTFLTQSNTALVELTCDTDIYHNLTSSATTPPMTVGARGFLPANVPMSYNLPAYARPSLQAKSAAGSCHQGKMTNK